MGDNALNSIEDINRFKNDDFEITTHGVQKKREIDILSRYWFFAYYYLYENPYKNCKTCCNQH